MSELNTDDDVSDISLLLKPKIKSFDDNFSDLDSYNVQVVNFSLACADCYFNECVEMLCFFSKFNLRNLIFKQWTYFSNDILILLKSNEILLFV